MESSVKISSSVIESIVLIAISETKNIFQPSKLIDKIIKHNCVKVEQEGQDLFIDVSVDINYGIFIPDAIKTVQEEIKNSVEIMTNLNVVKVNVLVEGLIM